DTSPHRNSIIRPACKARLRVGLSSANPRAPDRNLRFQYGKDNELSPKEGCRPHSMMIVISRPQLIFATPSSITSIGTPSSHLPARGFCGLNEDLHTPRRGGIGPMVRFPMRPPNSPKARRQPMAALGRL